MIEKTLTGIETCQRFLFCSIPDYSFIESIQTRMAFYVSNLCIGGDLIADIVLEQEAERFEALIARGWLEKKGELHTIHPIIRLVCQTEIPPTDEGCVSFYTVCSNSTTENDYQKDRYRHMAESSTNASRFLENPEGNYAMLAATLLRNLGDFCQALKCDFRIINKMEETLPPDRHVLAIGYSCLGEHKKALAYQQKALDIREKLLPQNRPGLAASCNNIAGTYHEMGQRWEAAQYFRRATDIIINSSLPEDHPNRMNITNLQADSRRKRKCSRT